MRDRLPKYALWLALALVGWFFVAAFFTKWGLIGWRFGFGFMTVTAGPILIAAVALVAVIALVLALRQTPRGPWWKAALALAIPLVLFGGLAIAQARGANAPPIHDVSTDVIDPPQFSARTMALRDSVAANSLVDYGTPLGRLDPWRERVAGELAIKTHADLIQEDYSTLEPIATGRISQAQVLDAVVAAMADIGLQDIRRDPQAGIVEGVAETFAFGFRDDVVVRVRDGRIDIRSVSRVGLSDLGYNAARVEELSEAIRARLRG